MSKQREVFKSVLGFVLVLMLVVFVLTGCSTVVPVTAKFPQKPEGVEKCAELKKLGDDAKLSDVSNIINDNYAEHFKCSIKNDTWNEWYDQQKKIFEGIK
jgi:hypothetical protein